MKGTSSEVVEEAAVTRLPSAVTVTPRSAKGFSISTELPFHTIVTASAEEDSRLKVRLSIAVRADDHEVPSALRVALPSLKVRLLVPPAVAVWTMWPAEWNRRVYCCAWAGRASRRAAAVRRVRILRFMAAISI